MKAVSYAAMMALIALSGGVEKRRAQTIMENFPKSEWTPVQKATVKEAEDVAHERSCRYYRYHDHTTDFDEDDFNEWA